MPSTKRHTGRVVPAGGEVEFFNKNDKAAALIRRFVVSAAATTLTMRPRTRTRTSASATIEPNKNISPQLLRPEHEEAGAEPR